eukprot:TRINITY_DN932_c0_g1_i1.p4 TRINITY_DN932_c0_g1~~TRINITY_DN932_c0_g1_i1.p4  ORF type:complete len:116 (-),score=46.07 TRINITY_DN932_c0_g1_i1:876-1223(-)
MEQVASNPSCRVPSGPESISSLGGSSAGSGVGGNGGGSGVGGIKVGVLDGDGDGNCVGNVGGIRSDGDGSNIGRIRGGIPDGDGGGGDGDDSFQNGSNHGGFLFNKKLVTSREWQ